jgi:hypothetical protein
VISWGAIAGGLVLTGLGWAACRFVARARPRLDWALAVDLAGPYGLFAILLAATARPWFAGATSFAVFGGLAFADKIKRETLLEPVMFSDMSEFIEIFRHPRLYLPFAGTGLVVGGFLAVAASLAALLALEPGQWDWSPWPGAIAVAAALALAVASFQPPLLGAIARFARWLAPQAEPAADVARLGPIAVLPIYGAIARAERAQRRPPPPAPLLAPRLRSSGPPIVMLQGESFFDARRLHPAMPADLLPAFTHCAETGIQSGRFAVGGWGAYTIRAELAALTGIAPAALGFDRWNPYHAFARARLPSLAWRLREEGYRTICLHPFDPRYYGRHKIMPRLGFDAFLGEDYFAGGERVGPYIADAELARRAAAILRDEGRGVFLFVITMENHGPWRADGSALPDLAPALSHMPDHGAVRGFLNGLTHTDALLGTLRDTLRAGEGGLLAAYGDHLPSLPRAFAALNFTDSATDYTIWSPQGGAGARRDLAAHELPDAIWAARTALR